MNAIFVSKLLVLLCHFLTVQSYRLQQTVMMRSRLARGAWIETIGISYPKSFCTSRLARGAWIETLNSLFPLSGSSRASQGARGLKHKSSSVIDCVRPSRLARGAWIETDVCKRH